MAKVTGMLTFKTGRLLKAGPLGVFIVAMCLKAGLPVSWFGTVEFTETPKG